MYDPAEFIGKEILLPYAVRATATLYHLFHIKANGLIRNSRTNTTHCTIQEAIYFAQAGDVILVGPGTYFESIDLNKDITLPTETFALFAQSDPIQVQGLEGGRQVVDADGTAMTYFVCEQLASGDRISLQLSHLPFSQAGLIVRIGIACVVAAFLLLAGLRVSRMRRSSSIRHPADPSPE